MSGGDEFPAEEPVWEKVQSPFALHFQSGCFKQQGRKGLLLRPVSYDGYVRAKVLRGRYQYWSEAIEKDSTNAECQIDKQQEELTALKQARNSVREIW